MWYEYGLPERCRMLADEGFVRDESRVWRHSDGRAIGEGVMNALIDPAFFRFLSIDPPTRPSQKRKQKQKGDVTGTRRRRKPAKGSQRPPQTAKEPRDPVEPV